MDTIGFFLIGFCLGLIVHAAISHLMNSNDVDKQLWRETSGTMIFEAPAQPKEEGERPVIIKAVDEVTVRQMKAIRKNQARGEATYLTDL